MKQNQNNLWRLVAKSGNMKYSVVYLKPKKKGQFSKQSAVFLDVESAFFWKNVIESQGCKDIDVHPVF
jgi:hypothetical protein